MKFRPPHKTLGLIAVLLLLAPLSGLLGGQTQPGILGSGKPAAKVEDVDSSLKMFSTVLGVVEENYATKVDSDKAVYGSIDGMLRTLDPHSRFLDPKAYAALRDDQRGRYFGLGITITTRFGKVTVVSPPFKDSPAEKVGLRVGDVISRVNGESTENMSTSDVVSRIKGPRGTTVIITIDRPGAPEPINISVMRDEVAKSTINNAFLIRPRIGYIKLESFEEKSGQELNDALAKLDYKNLDGLIFDLRENPGGLLTAAIQISETFLQKGQVIVETRGRARGSQSTYTSQKTNTDNPIPLVVLVNANSASASEIVTGALQDHDRALVAGETSFGKGLVQSIYQLKNQSALLLTTQKWYTPSGRLIQRDYSHVSQFDYYNHLDAASKDQKKDDIKYSDLGRVVYGGGGITPDYAVAEPKANDFQISMAKNYAFYTFCRDFLAPNPKIDPSFQVSDAMVADFKKHLQTRNIAFTDQDFEANKDYVRRMIRFELFYDRLGTVEASRVTLEADPQVLKALELMPEAKNLAMKAKQALAQKQGSLRQP